MSENYIKIESKANIKNLASIRLCITSFLSEINIHFDELMDIKTALSEAVTNAIDHGYAENEDGVIITEATIKDDEKIIIKVVDFGKGIEDISLAMTPAYTSKPESEHAGMGFTIMESFMDDVKIESALGLGTKITMRKQIGGEKQEEEMDVREA